MRLKIVALIFLFLTISKAYSQTNLSVSNIDTSGINNLSLHDTLDIIDYNLLYFFQCKPFEKKFYSGKDTLFFTETNYFSPPENIKVVVEYENGQKIKATGYFNNGIKYIESNFKNCSLNGLLTEYSKRGNLVSFSYYENGKIVLPEITLKDDGNIESFKCETYNGETKIYNVWYPNGKIKERFFRVDSLPEKLIHEIFYPNGQLEFRAVKDAKIDCYNGWCQQWYENGKKKIDYFFNTPKDSYFEKCLVAEGVWTYWDDKGNVIAKETYSNNKLVKINRFQNKSIENLKNCLIPDRCL